jgi:hypothetical protein
MGPSTKPTLGCRTKHLPDQTVKARERGATSTTTTTSSRIMKYDAIWSDQGPKIGLRVGITGPFWQGLGPAASRARPEERKEKKKKREKEKNEKE